MQGNDHLHMYFLRNTAFKFALTILAGFNIKIQKQFGKLRQHLLTLPIIYQNVYYAIRQKKTEQRRTRFYI